MDAKIIELINKKIYNKITQNDFITIITKIGEDLLEMSDYNKILKNTSSIIYYNYTSEHFYWFYKIIKVIDKLHEKKLKNKKRTRIVYMDLEMENYIDELVNLVHNRTINLSAKSFKYRVNIIGKEIFNEYGADGLFYVSRGVYDTVSSEFSSEYSVFLRELEWALNGITPEYQA